MNQDINPLELVARDLSQSASPTILLPLNPSIDAIQAAITLYIALAKFGKSASIACPSTITAPIQNSQIIRSDLGSSGNNLVISFPYEDGSIEKVDYKIENGTFNLIVIPRAGYPKITPEQVSYSYAGGQTDCFVVIGAVGLEALGTLYSENQHLFEQLPLIVIDKNSQNTGFGSTNYIRPETASLSELVLNILGMLQIGIDEEIASHALNGIMAATNNFSTPSTNAEVFERAAELMRLGAVRQQIPSPSYQQSPKFPQQQRDYRNDMNSQSQRHPQQPTEAHQRPNQTVQSNVSSRPNAPRSPVSVAQNQISREPSRQTDGWVQRIPQDPPSQHIADDDQQSEETDDASNTQNQAPQDWLKPKIFKGGGFI